MKGGEGGKRKSEKERRGGRGSRRMEEKEGGRMVTERWVKGDEGEPMS